MPMLLPYRIFFVSAVGPPVSAGHFIFIPIISVRQEIVDPVASDPVIIIVTLPDAAE
ncbi:hypothetical protein D9M69_704620 [compost metagenome]